MPSIRGLCYWSDFLTSIRMSISITGNATVYETIVSVHPTDDMGYEYIQLTHMYSMTEDRIDDLKLEFIANRSERGRIAVEQLKASRLEKFKKMSGRKDI